MSDDNVGPDPKPSGGGMKWVAVALVGALAGGAAVWFATRTPKPDDGAARPEVAGISRTPADRDDSPPVDLPAQDPAAVAIVVDVASPAKVRAAVLNNAWMKEALSAPLGRGFLGSWAGFLGTRGSDVGGVFAGTLFEFMLERVLSTPFRAVWFGGNAAPRSPAVVVPDAGGGAKAAFEAIDRVARRGTVHAQGCRRVGAEGVELPAEPLVVARWLLADHAVFAAVKDASLYFSRDVGAVVQAACASLDAAPTEADVAVSLFPPALGREAEQLALLTGLVSPRLEFMIEQHTLVPRGLAGGAQSGRLDASALNPAVLAAVPEDVPVMMALGLNLPKTLDANALAGHFRKADGDIVRHAALVWVPRGGRQPVETALVWSRGEDLAALQELFDHPWNWACDTLVLSSSIQLLGRMQDACSGKQPSVLNGPPQVTAGLRAPASVALGVHLGRVLSGVTVDAYREETSAKSLPAEIESARTLLQSLPFLGLVGLVKGDTLVPRGFRS